MKYKVSELPINAKIYKNGEYLGETFSDLPLEHYDSYCKKIENEENSYELIEFSELMKDLDYTLDMSLSSLRREMLGIEDGYARAYKDYYEKGTRESAFLKDLADSLIGLGAIFNVYRDDGRVHPDYALEKIHWVKSIVESAEEYYIAKKEELELEE